MTDFVYVVVTLVVFAGLTLLVATLDRLDQRSTQQSDR